MKFSLQARKNGTVSGEKQKNSAKNALKILEEQFSSDANGKEFLNYLLDNMPMSSHEKPAHCANI